MKCLIQGLIRIFLLYFPSFNHLSNNNKTKTSYHVFLVHRYLKVHRLFLYYNVDHRNVYFASDKQCQLNHQDQFLRTNKKKYKFA